MLAVPYPFPPPSPSMRSWEQWHAAEPAVRVPDRSLQLLDWHG